MAALERFIRDSIEEQFPRRKRRAMRNDSDDIAVIREAARAAAEALRNGAEEVQLDIWYK
jgi:hypothetical protein